MMEQVKSFKNIKENKPPPDPHTQRVTADIKHMSLYFPQWVSRDESILFIVDVCPLSQNSALTGDQMIALVPQAGNFP